MKPYERFIAWRHCHQLALSTYRLTEALPKSELYGITSQMRRAAASAAANLAEGSAKRGRPEFRRFMDITLGSLAELSYFALLARDLKLISADAWKEFERLHEEASKTTMGLYKAVDRRTVSDGHRSNL
jgi:four helix bundle protein